MSNTSMNVLDSGEGERSFFHHLSSVVPKSSSQSGAHWQGGWWTCNTKCIVSRTQGVGGVGSGHWEFHTPSSPLSAPRCQCEAKWSKGEKSLIQPPHTANCAHLHIPVSYRDVFVYFIAQGKAVPYSFSCWEALWGLRRKVFHINL